MATLPRTAVNALFAPLVSRYFVAQNHAALQTLVARTATWSALGSLAIALPLAAFAPVIFSWFGADFIASSGALRILLAGQVVAAAAGPQQFVITMTGNERAAALLLVGSITFNGVASLVLIDLWVSMARPWLRC